MTSINTNIAAQTAMRTLQATNSQLDATQNRISTGLRIGEAKDNAAYWSIATTLRSDNKALGTVNDALSLGAATVDTAYQGLKESLTVLDEIKSKLMAATNGNVDKLAVGREIQELQEQLKSIADAATFAGENWLSTDGSGSGQKTIVSGFMRDGNQISLKNIEINTNEFVLRNGADGLLEGEKTAIESGPTHAFAELFSEDGASIAFGDGEVTLGAREVVSFGVQLVADGPIATVQIDQRLVNETLSVTDGRIRNSEEFEEVLKAAFAEAKIGVTTDADDDTATTINITGATIAVAGEAYSREGVLGITGIENMTPEQIRSAINTVTAAAATVTASSTTLGAIASRIEMQQSFVNNLMDTIDRGISGLVDADMNEESTRLQALQVKQQLGVQALGIANQSAQNVLRLFQ